MTTETVQVRHLIPSEGKAIKNALTEEYFPEGLYLAKEESEADYIEVDASEVPKPEEPESEPDESAET